ncbi:MAG: exodeoxyribonuclease V subunit alpha [Betaproteobacteria bacterium]
MTATHSPVSTLGAGAVLATLQRWANKGWLRRIDSALANFVHQHDPRAQPAVLVAAALLTHREGRGHTCMSLQTLLVPDEALLEAPPEAQLELAALWGSLPLTLDGWEQALRASPLVRSLAPSDAQKPPAADQGQPLVLGVSHSGPLLYLRRYYLHEQHVAQSVLARCAASHAVVEVAAARWLGLLFDGAPVNDAPTVGVDWQQRACAVALRAGLTVITGGPGTGKTYTAARLLALLFALQSDAKPLRIGLAAPTGKAAARLRQAIDTSLSELSQRLGTQLDLAAFTSRIGAAKTLHALLGARPDTRQFRFHRGNLLDLDVLIVDEASMVHLEMMSALLEAMPSGARLVFLGDKDQLASVEAGSVLGDLCRAAASAQHAHPLAQQTVVLQHSRRFGGAIGRLALAVNVGQSAQALQLLAANPEGALQGYQPTGPDAVWQLAVHGRAGARACYADYLHTMRARPDNSLHDPASHSAWVKAVVRAFDRFRILCAVHAGEWGTGNLNRAIEHALAQAGLLAPSGAWFSGRPVMVTRNDPELGVFNGDVGVALPGLGKGTALRVYFLDGDQLRSVSVSRLAHVETAFAMTVHKSQGSEFEHTVLVLPAGGSKVLGRELVYTGITRARQQFTLVEGQAGLLAQAIAHASQRVSGLEHWLA